MNIDLERSDILNKRGANAFADRAETRRMEA